MRVCMSPRRLCSTFTWRGISVYLEIPVFVHFSFGSHVCKKNNNNKNWNPVLLLWRRRLRFHHYLKFCYARFWFTEVCTLFFWCWVILMYVLPVRNYLFGSGSNLFECNGSSCFQAPVFCIPPWIIFGSSDGFAAIYWSLLHSMTATWWTTTTPNFSTSCGASPCPIHKSRDGYLSVLQTPLGFPRWQAQSPLSVNCSQITKLSYFFAVSVGSHSEVNLSKSVRDKKDPLHFLMGCCCSFLFYLWDWEVAQCRWKL